MDVTALVLTLLVKFAALLSLCESENLLRAAMCKRIGGTTGDTAGALVELTELVVLATAVVVGQVRIPYNIHGYYFNVLRESATSVVLRRRRSRPGPLQPVVYNKNKLFEIAF